MAIPSEQEIQDRLKDLIESGSELFSRIEGKEDLDRVAGAFSDPKFEPSFPIDYLLRERAVLSARHCLGRLHSLERVSDSKSSIGLQSNERLFPDLLYCSREDGTIVLFEVKRSRQTARETATEILAYHHELRNHLPFIANDNIVLVIVATDYSQLLDHSVSSLIAWSAMRILCLTATLQSGYLGLAIHLPSSWQPIGQLELPASALRTADLCLYPVSDEPIEDIVGEVMTAVAIIAREAEQGGGSGFVMVWRDNFFPRISECEIIITVGVVNHFGFLPAAELSGLLPPDTSSLRRYLLAGDRCEELAASNNDLFEITQLARDYLSAHFRPVLEGWAGWAERRRDSRHCEDSWTNDVRTLPMACDFWGVLGSFARKMVSNHGRLRNFMPHFAKWPADWRKPHFAVQLIDRIACPPIVTDGQFGAVALFALGLRLARFGYIAQAYCKTKKRDRPALLSRLFWAEADLVPLLNEIRLRYLAAKGLGQAPPALRIGRYESSARVRGDVQKMSDWIEMHFLAGGPEILLHMYGLGIRHFRTLDNALWSDEEQEAHSQNAKMAAAAARSLLAMSFKQILGKDGAVAQRDRLAQMCGGSAFWASLDLSSLACALASLAAVPDEELTIGLVSIVPKIVDIWAPQLCHEMASVCDVAIDWSWIKQQIDDLYAAGNSRPCVQMMPDGSVGTALLDGVDRPIPVVYDRKREVLVYREHMGFKSIVVTTWKDLEAGGAALI